VQQPIARPVPNLGGPRVDSTYLLGLTHSNNIITGYLTQHLSNNHQITYFYKPFVVVVVVDSHYYSSTTLPHG